MPSVFIAKRAYQWHERVLRRPTFDYLATIEQSQWLNREEIEAIQAEKLTQLLKLAVAHCPWHAKRIRAAGLIVDAGATIGLNDLRQLPTMCKDDIRNHREQMVWCGVPGGIQAYNTGGSTGAPLSFYFGRMRQAADAAGRMRARRWWGVDVGAREIYLWGAPVELNKTDRIKTVRDRLLNQMILNAFEMSPAQMDRYVAAINNFKPACIYGYASSLTLLAAHVQTQHRKLRLPNLRVVCTTGEPLYQDQRRRLEAVFGTPVANEFGSRDIGFTAHESPSGQILLMSESIILEVVDGDGRPVAPGSTGEAVMTGLCSMAQPFIRYRTGDILRLSTEPCRQGRGLHTLAEIVGRRTDFVVRKDGTIMHALAIIYILRAIDAVKEFRFIQHTVDSVEVVVVPTAEWSEQHVRAIRTGIAARLGEHVQIDIRLVQAIEATASGKHRYVISHVSVPEALPSSTTHD